MKDELIIHNENFQQYKKIVIVDDKDQPILEYSLTKNFRDEKNESN